MYVINIMSQNKDSGPWHEQIHYLYLHISYLWQVINMGLSAPYTEMWAVSIQNILCPFWHSYVHQNALSRISVAKVSLWEAIEDRR